MSNIITKMLIELLEPARKTEIVDIGANPANEPPYKALIDAGQCRVTGFEPHPLAFARLKPRDSQHFIRAAVGDGTEGVLHITHSGSCSSMLEPNTELMEQIPQYAPAFRVVKKESMKTLKLADIDEIQDIDLLKIDIQGGEVAVFRNSGRKLSKALAVITEVAAIKLYRDQPLLDEQMAELRKLGFDLHKIMFLKSVMVRQPDNPLAKKLNRRRFNSQGLDGDAVFLRGIGCQELLEDEQLKHLAVLAHGVFQSYDVVAESLWQLVRRGRVDEARCHTYIDAIAGGA